MMLCIGTPLKLSELALTCPDLQELKKRISIVIIDDEPFIKQETLRNHGFNIVHFEDIKTINQIIDYPIVICDIKGVGSHFDSKFEGAHLLSEIRKAYPDKFLITYSGKQYDVSYNEILQGVDAAATKDASTEYWVNLLEKGLKSVGDPKERWIRFRKSLVEKGIDAYVIFELEQSFIDSVKRKDSSIMGKVRIPDEIKELVKAFVSISLSQLIGLTINK